MAYDLEARKKIKAGSIPYSFLKEVKNKKKMYEMFLKFERAFELIGNLQIDQRKAFTLEEHLDAEAATSLMFEALQEVFYDCEG